jgi:hypothetical protein
LDREGVFVGVGGARLRRRWHKPKGANVMNTPDVAFTRRTPASSAARSPLPPRALAAILLLGTACPSISTNTKHPDSDKTLTVTAGPGSMPAAVNHMVVKVDGWVCADVAGPNATCNIPLSSYSNQKVNLTATATDTAGNTRTNFDYVYVSNPKGYYWYPMPNGSNAGYPNATAEQTAANLHRLDKTIVHTHATNAVLEYASATGKTPFEVANTADLMVAAVARYVDRHMSWRSDSTNQTVFAANGWASYSPGWDFPQPADLTLTISGNLVNAVANDDFQGDCEDHAILRAALLRALGFAPGGIWDVIDNPVTHEYNVVLYEGAYRLMDYGEISRWLATHSWSSHQSYYGWNQNHGPRGAVAANNTWLSTYADNYPGGKDDGQPWSYNVYYKDTSP